jgi:uncharacterized OB-fold protein
MPLDRSKIEEMLRPYLAAMEEEKGRTGLPLLRDEKSGDPLYFGQRELRLRYLIPVKSLKEFFDGLARGEVLYTRCENCGLKYFPPQPTCSRCGKGTAWLRISGEGELLTFTKVYSKPASFLHYDDYIVGVARFPEQVSVLALIKARDVTEIRMGARVRLVVERREPENYYTYALIPVEATEHTGQTLPED